MMKHSKRTLAALVLAAAFLAGAGAAATAGGAGSADDPLVTLSYLNQIFAPAVDDAVDKAVRANEEALTASLNAAIDQWSRTILAQMSGSSGGAGGAASGSFQVVTLSGGQTLSAQVGCEVMLRIGSALCAAPDAPGLIDTTTGGVLDDGGALDVNHLYLVTLSPRGVQADSGTVKLLVRGEFTIL